MKESNEAWTQRFQNYLNEDKVRLQHYNLSVKWKQADQKLDYQKYKVHLLLSAHDPLWEFFLNTILLDFLSEESNIFIIDGNRDANYTKRSATMALCNTSMWDRRPSKAMLLKLDKCYEVIRPFLVVEDQQMIQTELVYYFQLCTELQRMNTDIIIINLPERSALFENHLISMLQKIAEQFQITVFIHKAITRVPYFHFPNETDVHIPINEAMILQSITSLHKPEMKPEHKWETEVDKKGENYAQINVVRNKNGMLPSLEMRMDYRKGVLGAFK